MLRLPDDELPPDWRAFPWPDATQALGTLWFETAASVALEVPSAVVPAQRNVLLNPRHPDAARVAAAAVRRWQYDPRLLWRPTPAPPAPRGAPAKLLDP